MNDLAEIDKRVTLHPYTNLVAHDETGPFVITRGEGIYVWDDQGNRHIEGMSGLWCASLGFSEQRLIDAATRQMQTLPYSHLFSHRATSPAIELAEELVKLAPGELTRAFFVNSGSEAVDMAVKIVWYYNQRAWTQKQKENYCT